MGRAGGIPLVGNSFARLGAFKPAKVHLFPWHALLEQKEELSLPPALRVSWHCWQDVLNWVRCSASQVVERCDSGSSGAAIEITGAGPPIFETSGSVWQRLHSRGMACLLS